MSISRRSLRLSRSGGRKFSPTYPKRQKLSFFIVVAFLTIFGLILLAELLFADESDSFPEEDVDLGGLNSLSDDHGLLSFRTQAQRSNLKRRQDAMEQVIKNLSSQLYSPILSSKKTQRIILDHKNLYSSDEVATPLDFTLESTLGHDAVWQPVNGTSHKFYVYSAYFDNRGKRPLIRILAVTKTKMSDFVYCKMYYKDGGRKPWSLTRASISVIRENWNLKYSASFVICNLRVGSSVPESVSVISTGSKDPQSSNFYTISNQLPVNEFKSGAGSVLVNSSDIGVCVKPLHFHYAKTLELVEFIELNRILGVSKFTFYNDTISSEVSCVLHHYKSQGIVNIHPWKLKIQSQKEIRTEGLFAALNDCLYRNMNYFKYLMLIDADEFIIPRMNDTIPEMIEYLERHKSHFGYKKTLVNRRASAYSFQNSFFYLQFPDEPESDSSLRVLRKTRRKVKFNPQKQRSKYICVPRDVKEAGNHFIWEFVASSGKSLSVPTELGFLHHYRVCEFGGDDCINAPSVVDKTVYKYKDLLIKNVEKVFESLHSKCPSAVESLIQDQKAQTDRIKKVNNNNNNTNNRAKNKYH